MIGEYHQNTAGSHCGEDPLQLRGVVTACQIRVVLVGEAVVVGIGDQPFHLAGEALGLELERVLEGLGLEASRGLLLMGREGALDRIAEQDYQSCRG